MRNAIANGETMRNIQRDVHTKLKTRLLSRGRRRRRTKGNEQMIQRKGQCPKPELTACIIITFPLIGQFLTVSDSLHRQYTGRRQARSTMPLYRQGTNIEVLGQGRMENSKGPSSIDVSCNHKS